MCGTDAAIIAASNTSPLRASMTCAMRTPREPSARAKSPARTRRVLVREVLFGSRARDDVIRKNITLGSCDPAVSLESASLDPRESLFSSLFLDRESAPLIDSMTLVRERTHSISHLSRLNEREREKEKASVSKARGCLSGARRESVSQGCVFFERADPGE